MTIITLNNLNLVCLFNGEALYFLLGIIWIFFGVG
jgi:hypothetical protein